MHEMFSRAIAPRIKNLQTGKPSEVLLTRTIHTFGTGESNVAEMLGDVMTRGRNPLVNCTVANGIISLRINARAETPQQAAAMFKPVEAEIHQRLGNLVFGYDQETLASVVGQRLREKKATLAVAESCTGGGLAKALTDIPGSSDYFLGGLLTFSNEVKINLLHVDRAALIEHGAVSEIVARQMAEQTRRLIGSDYALSITGIAGPGGGTAEKPVGLVFMGLADRQETFVARHIFTGDRATIRQRCVNMTLNLMRLKLIS
jgi:nicotinamide-nucleotide amidase